MSKEKKYLLELIACFVVNNTEALSDPKVLQLVNKLIGQARVI